MKRLDREISTLVALILLFVPTLGAASEGAEEFVKRGDDLFRQGHFAEAEKEYKAALAGDAVNRQATLRLGEIALLGNRFKEAEQHLERAVKLSPDDDRPNSLLAEVYYRQDDFPRAERLFRETGKQAVADKLASFKEQMLYKIVGDADTTQVKFVQTDPLPIVRARVNNGDEIYLLIDTGAATLFLDLEYADSLGVPRFGSTEGTFAGGKKATVYHGKIESIRLGEFEIRNVPVVLKPTRQLPFAAGGERISGIIGTALLYHFLSTLDYPNEQLTLRRKTDKMLADFEREAESQKAHVVPFWMARMHFMVAWGQVNDADPCLFFADTGLAGGGFLCPESTIKAAGIDLTGLPSFQGMGGGGPVTVTPFTVKELSLGDAKRQNVTGMFGAFPPSSEYSHGFRIGGIISHGFFKPYALTFDFDRMRLYLTPGK